MKKLKSLFKDYEITYKRLIIFSVVVAIVVALLNEIPFLKDTSFTDPAVNFDIWFLFAMFIIMNAKSAKEASIKTFLFFLISQPLIYLIEVPFESRGFEIFQYYRYWFILTILTLPGAYIAYYVKKQNWLSVLILSVANVYLTYMNYTYFLTTLERFPRHILSSIFCLALALFFIFVFFDDDKKRIASILIMVLTLAVAIFNNANRNKDQTVVIDLNEEGYACELLDDKYASLEVDGSILNVHVTKSGAYIVDCKKENNTQSYNIVVDGKDLMVSEID